MNIGFSRRTRSDGRTRRRRSLLAVAVVAGLLPLTATATLAPAANAAGPVGQGFNLNPSDLRFILKQIKISEEHAATATPANPCGTLLGSGANQIPNQNGQGVLLPWGLRTVDGTCNNLTTGKTRLGAADNTFPRVTTPRFRNAEDAPADFFGPGSPSFPTSYTRKTGSVFDSQPRLASNLIVDQTAGNPAAVDAAGEGATVENGTLLIPNTAPDVGLSAPYNSMFTIFGQFFDHGLDLTNKSGGTVFMPLKADDPLFNPAPGSPNFMVLTRATNQPGPDGVVGDRAPTDIPRIACTSLNVPAGCDESIDDVQNATNQTSTFVDQSQTYTSHPSHQVFLREYADKNAGAVGTSVQPVSTGRMLTGPGDGLATWESTKAQAAALLGIQLSDRDVFNVPLLATDPYGKFIPGPNGYPQLVVPSATGGLVEGNPLAPVTTAGATKTGHAFLDDIAHHAAPSGTKTPDQATGPDCILEDDLLTEDVNESADNTPDGITPAAGAQCAGTYDDEMLNAHFVAGDGRLNENIALSAVHQVFHSEHNRLVGDVDDEVPANRDIKSVLIEEDPGAVDQWKLPDGSWNGEYLFQAARFVTEMEYQHLAFEEFARKVQPMINLFSGYDTSVDPAITAEFAHTVYRFGHSMLNETVPRTTPSGAPRDIDLLDAFLNPPAYAEGGLTPEQASGDIVRGLTSQVGNELDEFVTEALRNRLLGLPLDLASLNMARGRDTGIPSLNGARRQFYATTNQTALAPYANWIDFGLEIKHPLSLINFVAAYGLHPTILTDIDGPDDIFADDPDTAVNEATDNNGPATLKSRRTAAALLVAGDPLNPDTPADSVAFMNGTGPWANANGVTTTGLDDVDFWVGGLAEKQAPFGGLLGSSFNYIFETQMENLQDGDRFYYLSRTAGLNMLVQLEGNSFSEMITRNTDAVNLPADVFSRPDLTFDLSVQGNTPGTPIVDDVATTEYDERTLLIRMTDGTVRYAGDKHVVFNGSADPSNPNQNDWGRSSEGDDTLRGNNGDDRFEGGAGNDHFIGGLGQDILTDSFGDDVLKGGDGNDALSSGPGFDLNQSGRGHDFVVGGSDPTETFGGPGNDLIFGGDSSDTVFGDDGNDWIEGGGQADLLQGDNGAPFQDDPNAPGHDVINGNGGADDYDSEGGDDIMIASAGVERSEGMLGFDWVTHKLEIAGDGTPVNADDDLNLTGLLPPSVETFRDRFDLVEALSGWNGNDTLRGDDRTDLDLGAEHELTQAGIDRISGLTDLVPVTPVGEGEDALPKSFNGGNIIVGGGGSDVIEGRGGDDILDGDVWLNARLSVRSPSDPAVEIGSANSMLAPYLPVSTTTLQQAVFAGTVDPGNIVIVREMLTAGVPADVDTAVFTGPRNNYTIVTDGPWTTVTDTVGLDGVDRVRNVEQLRFSDRTVVLGTPSAPVIGTVTAGDTEATVNFTAGPDNGTQPISEFRIQALTGGVVDDTLTVTGIAPTATQAVVTGLTNGTPYTFRVIAVNAVGESQPSAESIVVWPDVPLALVSTTPADNAVDVSVSANQSGTFSRPVTSPNFGDAVQLRTATGAIVGRVVTYDPATRTVTVNPNANLVPGASYTLTFVGTGVNGIRDLNGTRLETTTIVFRTLPDTVAPVVTTSTPADGATGVRENANVIVDFSERIVGVSQTSVVLTNVTSGATIAKALNLNAAGTRLTVNPNPTLTRNTLYRVTLIGGPAAIRDPFGNALVTTTISFRIRP